MTGANVARAMQVSAPTVHEMIGRLEADGYVTRAGDKSLSFTDTGREHAEDIVRRHRLIERFLTDVFDIPWDQVHEEAERLEHWMSPTVEERMLKAIGDAKTCPHGHPIFTERARSRACRWPTSRRAPRCASCGSRTRPRTCCTTSWTAGLTPGLEGKLAESGDDEVAIEADGDALHGHPQRGRDRVGDRRPVTAAAHGAARAAGARQGALGALDRAARPAAPAGRSRAASITIATKGTVSDVRQDLARPARPPRGRPTRPAAVNGTLIEDRRDRRDQLGHEHDPEGAPPVVPHELAAAGAGRRSRACPRSPRTAPRTATAPAGRARAGPAPPGRRLSPAAEISTARNRGAKASRPAWRQCARAAARGPPRPRRACGSWRRRPAARSRRS